MGKGKQMKQVQAAKQARAAPMDIIETPKPSQPRRLPFNPLLAVGCVASVGLGMAAMKMIENYGAAPVVKTAKAPKAKKISKKERDAIGKAFVYDAETACENPMDASPLDLKVNEAQKPCMESYRKARKRSDYHFYQSRCDIDYPGRPPFCDSATQKLENKEFNEKNPEKALTVYVVENFLSEEEADELVRLTILANPPKSTTTNSGDDHYDDSFRTSRTFSPPNAPGSAWNEFSARIAALLGVPDSFSETPQVQWYAEGQVFKPHQDFFHSCDIYSAQQWEEFAGPKGQRNFTAITYLNDLAEHAGGRTKFNTLGLDVQPKKGSVLIFRNQDNTGSPLHESMHEGAPPAKDTEKFIVTKWFRDSNWNDHTTKYVEKCLDRGCRQRVKSDVQLLDTAKALVKMMPEHEQACFKGTKYWS